MAKHTYERPSRLPAVRDIWLRLEPDIRRVAREHGYAVAVHGSLARDIDLIAVPWVTEASSPADLAEAICVAVGGYIRNDGESTFCKCGLVPCPHDRTCRNPEPKPHGRLAWSIHVAGCTYLDLSVISPSR